MAIDPIDPNLAQPIEPVKPGEVGSASKPSLTTEGKSFGDVLSESIQEVNRMQIEADSAIEKLATGEKDFAEVVNAVEKADLAFSTLMQIRNRLVDAYQEIMRIRT